MFKKELDQLTQIGALERALCSEWLAGTFIRPKKDGQVRWISDFWGLNKYLKRNVYPLPRIGDVLAKCTGYQYPSKIDISMQYYTFEMDEESRNLCTIVTPFGLYRYTQLPMGVSESPDIAQEFMENLLRDLLEEIVVYIDDILVTNHDWKSHLILLDKVLVKLEDAGFLVDPRKCEWAVQEMDFLGHWMTPSRIKPRKKKVDAIICMERLQNRTQLRSFLGMVNYYHDMWPQQTHILVPLSELTGKKKFHWGKEQDKAFKQMKALIAMDALLAYPGHNKLFEIETDLLDYQLGGMIKQEGRPMAYYSRKLIAMEKNYTTIEECLAIVEILKHFWMVLLGSHITVFNDHKNLTHKMTKFSTQRVLHW